jgi:SnoaL-like domain
MTDVMTKDATAIVEAYFAMWNEGDGDKRAQHIQEAWADSGRYVDPSRDAEGHAALSEMVEVARGQFPGFTLRRSSGIDAHHDRIRFTWEAVAPDGTVPLAAIDFGVLASDGRLQGITGFMGELSQHAS